MKNAKTMFKVMNEFKRSEKPVSSEISKNIPINSSNTFDESKVEITNNSNEGPTFFV